MGALTPQGRRHVFVTRQQVTLLETAMIAALPGTGWLTFHAVEFHVPESIGAPLPRVWRAPVGR